MGNTADLMFRTNLKNLNLGNMSSLEDKLRDPIHSVSIHTPHAGSDCRRGVLPGA